MWQMLSNSKPSPNSGVIKVRLGFHGILIMLHGSVDRA